MFVILGMSRTVKVPEFITSMQNLKSISPLSKAFIGISKSEARADKKIVSDSVGSAVEFVPISDFLRTANNRTAQYSVFRNDVYKHALNVVPITSIDYIVIADVDMVYPISVDQWLSSELVFI